MSFFLANGSPADAKQMLEGMGIESRALVLFAVRPSVRQCGQKSQSDTPSVHPTRHPHTLHLCALPSPPACF
jgi:hypothetical protein